MKRVYDQILQTDARGRIQLPTPLRMHRFFSWTELENGEIRLLPVEFLRKSLEVHPPDPWVQEEASHYLKQEMLKDLRTILSEKKFFFEALVLYGSRATGLALHSSDIDIAVFVKDSATLKTRSEWTEKLELLFQPFQEKLARHQISGEFSFNFIPLKIPNGNPPGLYYSLNKQGFPLWDPNRAFQKWNGAIARFMKSNSVKSRGAGKDKVWEWKN